MIVSSTKLPHEKIFLRPKYDSQVTEIVESEKISEIFIDDEELEKISDRIIERNKNVYEKLAD